MDIKQNLISLNEIYYEDHILGIWNLRLGIWNFL
jgi:hypothetical protein